MELFTDPSFMVFAGVLSVAEAHRRFDHMLAIAAELPFAKQPVVERSTGRIVGYSGVDLAWDDCWRSYRRGTVAGVIMALAASMLVERTERGDEMFMVMAERHARHATDLDALGVLDR